MKKIELSLLEFFRAVVNYWWMMLVMIVVSVGIFAMYPLVEKGDLERPYEERLAAYEDQVLKREAKITELDQSIAQFEWVTGPYTTIRNNAYEYLWESPLMRINPFSVRKAYNTVHINADVPSEYPISSLTDYYSSLDNSLNLQNVLGNDFPNGYTEKNLSEIIQISKVSDDIFTIECYIIEDGKLNAENIVSSIAEYLDNQSPQLADAFGAHSLTVLDTGVASSIEPKLDEYVRSRLDNIARYEDLAYNYSTKIDSFKSQKEAIIAEYQMNPLVVPSASVLHKTSNNVLPIAFIGVILGILLICMLYIVKLPVLSYDQIRRHLGIRYLGSNRKSAGLSDKDSFALLVANIRESLTDNAKVLLTGTIPQSEISAVAERLSPYFKSEGVIFSSGGNILDNAETVNHLSESDAVILIEKFKGSRIRTIASQIERIGYSNKHIIGYIIS